MMHAEKEISTEEYIYSVEKFVDAHLVSAEEGRRCIDGRYNPSESRGMLARPGGDMGYVLGLLALSRKKGWKLSPEEAFDHVFEVVKGRGGFFYHSDYDHENWAAGEASHIEGLGCAHIGRTIERGAAETYGIPDTEVKSLLTYLHFRALHDDHILRSTLWGRHHEGGLIIVDNEFVTVDALDKYLGKSYFIYDRKRDMLFVAMLSAALNSHGLTDLTFSDYLDVLDQQTNLTLSTLAADLPVYELQDSGDGIQIRAVK